MKQIFFFLITFLSINIYGQITRLHFYYDNAGNQITRILNFNSQSTRTSENIIPKEVTELKEEDLLKFSQEDVISYYPNPVREELYLKWELTNENKVSSISVLSINSQHIKTFSNLEKENTKNIPFQEYPLGTYLVVLNYTNGEQKSITILKQ